MMLVQFQTGRNMHRLAKKLAQHSTHPQHHHAVIITKGGAVVAMGSNIDNQHAERIACEQLYPYSLDRVLMYWGDFPLTDKRWKGNNFTLWSFRWRKNGTWGMAKPCNACQIMLRKLGIKKVMYTDDEGRIVRL